MAGRRQAGGNAVKAGILSWRYQKHLKKGSGFKYNHAYRYHSKLRLPWVGHEPARKTAKQQNQNNKCFLFS